MPLNITLRTSDVVRIAAKPPSSQSTIQQIKAARVAVKSSSQQDTQPTVPTKQ